VSTSRHIKLVDLAVQLNRAVFAIRTIYGVTPQGAISIVNGGLLREYSDIREYLKTARLVLARLRKTWPKLSDIEILDLTTTITQAASQALLQTLRQGLEGADPYRPPAYVNLTSRRIVVADTLHWIELVLGEPFPVANITARVEDDYLDASAANKLVKDLIRHLSHMVAWKKTVTPPENHDPTIPHSHVDGMLRELLRA
jgi:hypothetical protein